MGVVEEGVVRREIVTMVDASEVVEIGVLEEWIAIESVHACVQEREREQAG